MTVADTLDGLIGKERGNISDPGSALDALIARNRVGLGKQIAGAGLVAAPQAVGAIARTGAVTAAMHPLRTAAQAFDGKTFDSFMQHIDSMEKRDAYDASRSDGLVHFVDISPTRVPSLGLTFGAGHGGKSPYEMAKNEAARLSWKESGGKPLDDDPANWPVTPRDAAMGGWARRMRVNKVLLDRARRKQNEVAKRLEGASPEHVQWAATYAQLDNHNPVSQAVIDFTSNWPNLAVAAGGRALDMVAPGVGAAASFGFMAAQEEGDFLASAEAAGIPYEIAGRYARQYGMASGGIEYSEQVINLAGLGGKAAKKAAQAMTRKVMAAAGSIVKDMFGEGMEEVSQQALQYVLLSKAARDYAKFKGVQPLDAIEKDSLPMNTDGSVNWRKASSDLARAFQAGAGVAAVSNVGGLAVRGPGMARNAVLNHRERIAAANAVTSSGALSVWAGGHTEAARALAGKDQPSRKDFDDAGLPRIPAQDRARVAADLRELLADAAPQEGTQDARETTPPEGSAVTQPPAPEVVQPPAAPASETKIDDDTTKPPETPEPVQAEAAPDGVGENDRIKALVVKRNDLMRGGLSASHPDVRAIDIEIEGLEQKNAAGIVNDSPPSPEDLVKGADGKWVRRADVAPPQSIVAGQKVDEAPTQAQKDAENYKKGHATIDGHDVSIENPVGTVRAGEDAYGDEWQQEMKADYGYIRGTVGYDKDHLDVFVKPGYDPQSSREQKPVHVIDQVDPKTGKFDEHKVVFGARDAQEATDIYNANYGDGWQGARSTEGMTADEFKEWAYDKKNGPSKGALHPERLGVREMKVEKPVAKPAPIQSPKAADLAGMDDADFDALMDEVEGELAAEKPEAPATQSETSFVEDVIGKEEYAKANKAKRKVGRKGVKKKAPVEKTAPVEQPADLAARIQSAASDSNSALAQASRELTKMFGVGKGRMGSGRINIDEKAYAAARPHLEAAYNEIVGLGGDLKDFIKWGMNSFGTGVRPYLKQFKNDLASGATKTETEPEGDSGHDNEDDSKPDQGGGPEGTQVGDGSRRPGSGKDAVSVDGNAPADADGTPKAGGGQVAGETPGGTGDGADGGRAGEATVTDGRPGTSGEGLVPDGVGRGTVSGDGPGGSDGPSGESRPPAVTDTQPNYVIHDPEALVGGGPKAKFARNKNAIKTYLVVTEEGRPATDEERDALAAYIGWGSFGQELFNGSWEHPKPKDGWQAEDAWLREHLGEQKWKSAQRSILNAHYTDPPTVSAMWDMVRRMGFKGGRVLEPAMGIGNFFGLMPKDLAARSNVTGIELDELTGGMAKMLYPQANISIKGYQESQTPDDFYDLVIGNWPFAADGPADRRYNKLSPTLHDYFFLKALDQVRPGGLVVGITSAGTMDKLGQQARLEMSKKADLVASFRLPTGAFGKYAGTKVVTDIIILRKRGDGTGLQSVPAWVGTAEVTTPAGPKVRVNAYYRDAPGHVLGTLNYGRGTTQGRPGMIVDRPSDFASQLARAVASVEEGAYQERAKPESERYVTNNSEDRVNSVMVDEAGDLWISQGEQKVRLEDRQKIAIKDVKKTDQRREQLRQLVGIRKTLGELIDQQREGHDSTEDTRGRLNKAYRSFVKNYGTINGSFALTQLKKANDPHYAQLAALEHNTADVDEKPLYAEAAILTRSTTRARPRPDRMTVQDAYVFQRNENLSLDVARIAELAKVSEIEAEATLEESNAVFRTPAGTMEHADEYLSGNVRLRLVEARNAKAEGIEGMDRNIEALSKVVPDDVPYFNIEAKVGNNWTPPVVYRQFIGEMLGVSEEEAIKGIEVAFSPRGWKVRISKQLEGRAEASSNFGTDSAPFAKLVEHAMRSTPVVVKVWDKDAQRAVVDDDLSVKANEKVATIQEHFSSWVWKDPNRRVELERAYNESYNNSASPTFAGDFLAFEGMMLDRGDKPFNLRQHQVSAIARGLISGRGIYAHEVGSGKTYTIGGIAVESRRYGKARKPLIFAHNANSATVAAEINEMYPGAKVLYVDNLGKANKAVTLSQIINDDWDAIVVPHSMADRFALRAETYSALAAAEIADLEAAALEAAVEDNVDLDVSMMDDPDAMKNVRSPTAKDLVRARNKIIERIEKMSQKSVEDAIILEDAGVDMIIVDEAHEFKKPPIATTMRMKGLNTAPSDRSINMMLMLQYVNGINNGRGVHLFTGTPITNTLNELYNMMRFVMQPEMKAEGVDHWDAWFSTFADETADVEVTAAGDYELTTRLASFVNVPELRRMAGQFMDTVFAEDMPEFHDRQAPSGKDMTSTGLAEDERDFLMNGRTEDAVGRPYKVVKTIVSPMTEAQQAIRNDLMRRANSFRQMNKLQRRKAMLSGSNEAPLMVEGDASKAGLDARLFSMEAPDDPGSKVNTAIDRIMDHYGEHDLACQVIFMEKGFSDHVDRTRTVGEGDERQKIRERFPSLNLAKDIVAKLVERGVPAGQIAIVDGKTSKQKRKAISAAMNTGEIRVVIGSTQTLGTGVNMQTNLRAMHHLDAPWKPGDLEQRNGRGWRQGNKWNSVIEYRYVTEGIDGRRWQVLVVKDRFIKAFLRGKGSQRIIEGDAAAIDDDGGGNDLATTLSDATGDPRILLIEKAKKDIDRLQRRERLHTEGMYETHASVTATKRKQAEGRELIAARNDVETLLAETAGQPFAITIDGKEYTDRKKAEKKIAALSTTFAEGKPKEIGLYRGFTLRGYWRKKSWFGSETENVMQAVHPDHTDKSELLSSGATVAGVDATLRNNKKHLAKESEAIEDAERSIERLTKTLDEPFPQQAGLDKAISSLEMLTADLERNPVPPPAWLRQPTPNGLTVTYQGKERVVAGHKWNDVGWFVVLEPVDENTDTTDAPYMDVRDEQGIPLYEEHEFTKPTLAKKDDADGKMGFAGRPAGEREDRRADRKIGRKKQDGTAVAKVAPTQPTKIIDTIRKLWPELSIRGRATFRDKDPGWYDVALGEMRLKNAGDIVVAVHELGHHFDRQRKMWSKSTGLASGIPGELVQLGRNLYGARTPAGGYRAEGFAEFIGQYLVGGDIRRQAPKLYDWFTTEYLPANPQEARKLRELEDVIAQFQIQTPEQAVKALLSPRRQDWSGSRIAAALAGSEAKHVDAFMPLWRGMQATGADLGKLKPTENPFMLATYFARTAGGRALNSMLSGSVDLVGRRNGESLRAIFSPAVDAGETDNVIRYWIAKRVLSRYHEHGLVAGLSREDAEAIVAKNKSEMFDQVIEQATEWAHQQLHLLVEAGAMTEAEFEKIVDMNPIYAPMMRQFIEGEKRKGRGKGGKGIYKVKGGQQPIIDPLTALAKQTERLHQVAMQRAVMRSIVQFYDNNKHASTSMGRFMSEVRTPQEAVTFRMGRIKKDLQQVLGRYKDGETVLEKLEAEEDAWDRLLTIFRPRKDYRGSDNVTAIEIDGKTRFFEVRADLLPILEGVTQSHFLGDGPAARMFRGATSLQRLGATGLNPAFGLIRNLIRDTGTATITGDYHFHVPVVSTLRGMLMDIANSKYAQMYHGAGLDIAGRVGQDLRSAGKAGQRVTARGHVQSIARAGAIDGLREILGHSEIGPRLMEFQAAHKYAMKQPGWTDADALVLAGTASKDVTVNFSRAGSDARKVNEVVLFYNAAIQSIDKFLRAFGAREAMPWAKEQSRAKTLSRTMAKGIASLTLTALANYLRNRDDEWWKNLPAYEKWNYIHIKTWGDRPPIRIPLPFEVGAVFAALPIAMLENRRAAGALRDAVSIVVENALPVDLGLDEQDFMRKVAALMRNVALFGPAADILSNKDWKGSDIIPRYLERKLSKDQHTHNTTALAKAIGRVTPGLAPARIDHLLNGYTAGLYRRTASGLALLIDPSGVSMSDPSTFPIVGTLFLKPGTSRVVGDFYERLDYLERRKGSDVHTAAEVRELTAAKRLSRRLSKLWSQRRKALDSDANRGDAKAAANEFLRDVQNLIDQHNDVWNGA